MPRTKIATNSAPAKASVIARSAWDERRGSRDSSRLGPLGALDPLGKSPALASMCCEVVTTTADGSFGQQRSVACAHLGQAGDPCCSRAYPGASRRIGCVGRLVPAIPTPCKPNNCRGRRVRPAYNRIAGVEDVRLAVSAPAGASNRDKGVFAANRFRLGGIALLILVWACAAAPAHGCRRHDRQTRRSPRGIRAPTDATFTVTLTRASGTADVTLDYQTVPGLPADPEDDFTPADRRGHLPASGRRSKTITVPSWATRSTSRRSTSTWSSRATVSRTTVTGTATILDDDARVSASAT